MVHETKPLMLIDLPIDIVLTVVSLLDLKDIFAMRMVCKSLHAISLERSVWATALVQLPEIPRPLCLLKPLYLHSSPELEDVVKRLYRVNRAWRRDGVEPARIVEINPPHATDVGEGRIWTEILPGGRWLLTTGRNNIGSLAVYYWDLDQAQPEASLLLDTKEIISQSDKPLSVSHIVNPKMYCAVYFGIITTGEGHDKGDTVNVYIWNVTYNHGRGTLEASSFKSFAIFTLGLASPNTSWDAKYFGMETETGVDAFPKGFSAFEWNKCQNGELHVSRFKGDVQTDQPVKTLFLPHNQVVFACTDAILIYQLPQVQVVPDLCTPWDFSHIPAIWKCGEAGSFGRPYPPPQILCYNPGDDDERTSITLLLSSREIRTINVPPHPTSLFDIQTHENVVHIRGRPSSFGRQRAAVLPNHRRLMLFEKATSTKSTSWVTPSIPPREPKEIGPYIDHLALGLAFDEQSGRVSVQSRYRSWIYYFE